MDKTKQVCTRVVAWLEGWLVPPRKGQGLVEYALILMLVSLVVITALAAFGTQLSAMYDDIQSKI
ncbi:MAG: hypothetical protein AVDCRST_MAG93-3424 [uncultured Chloroflexia bacterium]|uniref:Flp pilus assembly protein, pilin Flp n=1 Tax=uncultured Chloroflexia bacterium TaxID=1672391 RepID=A0A6J4JQ23_9CHLR|nr:MAG: hypothetical protein AVDCRST_MAG93-3424 [uncultured Chloroflexia bacterium]